MFSSAFFVVFGILIRRSSGSSQVFPKSVLFDNSAPKCQLTGPAHISSRPFRLSKKAEYTARPAKCGPSMDHLPLLLWRMKRPFAVPTINRRFSAITLKLCVLCELCVKQKGSHAELAEDAEKARTNCFLISIC